MFTFTVLKFLPTKLKSLAFLSITVYIVTLDKTIPKCIMPIHKCKRFQASTALYWRPTLRNMPEEQSPRINISSKTMHFQYHNKIEQEGTAMFNNSEKIQEVCSRPRMV